MVAKKILARETLFLFISALIILIVFLGGCLRASMFERQIISLIEERRQIEKINKREEFYNYLEKNNVEVGAYGFKLFWRTLEKYSSSDLKMRWDDRFPSHFKNAMGDLGITSPGDLQLFIDSTRLNKSEMNKLKSIQNRLFSTQVELQEFRAKQHILLKNTVIIILILLYLIRYSYYVLTWSVETLRDIR